jgi:hypothetical protein
VDIISNGSGSHHQLRKLDQRVQLILGATNKVATASDGMSPHPRTLYVLLAILHTKQTGMGADENDCSARGDKAGGIYLYANQQGMDGGRCGGA